MTALLLHNYFIVCSLIQLSMSKPVPSFTASTWFSNHITSAPMKIYIHNHTTYTTRGMGRRSIAELAGTRTRVERLMLFVPAKHKIFNHPSLYNPIFAKGFCKKDRSNRSIRQCYLLIPLHLLLFPSCIHQPWRCQTVTAVYQFLTSAGEGLTSLLLIKFVKS